jgi:hypothetical protein
MTALLKGYVLQVLGAFSVVINLGRKDNVKRGLKFIIYQEGEMVKDPKTGRDLEKLELVKARVEVTNVQESISTAETFETEERQKLSILPYELFGNVATVRKRLADEEPEPSDVWSVKPGDLARQLEE